MQKSHSFQSPYSDAKLKRFPLLSGVNSPNLKGTFQRNTIYPSDHTSWNQSKCELNTTFSPPCKETMAERVPRQSLNIKRQTTEIQNKTFQKPQKRRPQGRRSHNHQIQTLKQVYCKVKENLPKVDQLPDVKRSKIRRFQGDNAILEKGCRTNLELKSNKKAIATEISDDDELHEIAFQKLRKINGRLYVVQATIDHNKVFSISLACMQIHNQYSIRMSLQQVSNLLKESFNGSLQSMIDSISIDDNNVCSLRCNQSKKNGLRSNLPLIDESAQQFQQSTKCVKRHTLCQKHYRCTTERSNDQSTIESHCLTQLQNEPKFN